MRKNMKSNNISHTKIGVLTPLVTKGLFSQITGLTEEVIRGMIDKGHLPTIKIGRRRLINLALLSKEALEHENQ